MIHNVTPKALFQLNGSNPDTITFGEWADILNLCVVILWSHFGSKLRVEMGG